jgi:hypothetical protein
LKLVNEAGIILQGNVNADGKTYLFNRLPEDKEMQAGKTILALWYRPIDTARAQVLVVYYDGAADGRTKTLNLEGELKKQ